jgi:eukaryotic-like serine/threonine-protein kinase
VSTSSHTPMDRPAPAEWEEMDAILAEALERPVDARVPFLRSVCASNQAMFEALRSMLERADAARRLIGEHVDDFVTGSLVDPPDDDAGGGIEPGQRIGAYRVIREIGRGGMGAVYLAERADGQFEMRVAVKVAKRGMDSDEILRRFRHERSILASLEHPNIARLYDGGISDDGRSYLVMELVEGEPITVFCDNRRLTIEERLRLFLAVCDAVRYAHSNLIVHRDLKPSNIFVTPDGSPKLLDFGIAKILVEEDGAEPLTRTGVRVLTPGYAAPEQLAGEPVTTATDVYAMGAVLHELLTGVRPKPARPLSVAGGLRDHSGPALPRASETVAARTTDDVELARTRAAARSTTLERWIRGLRGDVDTILLTATEPDPGRRYGSPQQLADDIEHHLSSRPIRARPPSRGYRFRTFVRRHRMGVASAAVIATLVVASAGALLVQHTNTIRARDRAELEARKATQVASFLAGMFDAAAPGESRGDELTAREILERGARRLESELADQPLLQAGMFNVISHVYLSLDLIEEALPLAERALELRTAHLGPLHIEVAESENQLARIHDARGDFDSAEPLYRSALHARERLLGSEHAEVAESLLNLGLLLTDRADYAGAEPLLRRALAIDRKLFGDAHPHVATSLNNLAILLFSRGDYAGAETSLREALEIRRAVLGEPHPRVAITLHNLAAVVQRRGDHAEAERLHRQSLAMHRRVHGGAHRDVASSLSNLGALLTMSGRPAEAEQHLREALEIGRALGADTGELADALGNLAAAVRDLGRLEEADTLLEEALELNLSVRGPEHPRVGLVRYHQGLVLRARGDCVGAAGRFREALALQLGALPASHDEPARTRSALGGCLSQLGDAESARPLLDAAYAALRANHGDEHPDTREALERLRALPDRTASAAAGHR